MVLTPLLRNLRQRFSDLCTASSLDANHSPFRRTLN